MASSLLVAEAHSLSADVLKVDCPCLLFLFFFFNCLCLTDFVSHLVEVCVFSCGHAVTLSSFIEIIVSGVHDGMLVVDHYYHSGVSACLIKKKKETYSFSQETHSALCLVAAYPVQD